MEINNKFNIGDIVYFLECECIQKKKIENIRVFVNGEGTIKTFIYYSFSLFGSEYEEYQFFTTKKELLNHYTAKFGPDFLTAFKSKGYYGD